MIEALLWLAQLSGAPVAATTPTRLVAVAFPARPVAVAIPPRPARPLAVAVPAGPVGAATGTPSPAPTETAQYPLLAPAAVLQHYAAALKRLKEPRLISFDYTLEQTGLRTVSQTHRVFRSGNDERDETLVVDGKRLSPPKVRIFRGRRNHYAVRSLSPRPADYRFAYVASFKDGHHFDYVFRLTPNAIRPFNVTDVTIDGVRFLPVAIGFATDFHDGSGTIAFGSNTRWWVPSIATARATVATDTATEKLTFFTYRFPQTLPPSTFTQARRAAPRSPAPPTPVPAPLAPPGSLEPASAPLAPAPGRSRPRLPG